MPIENTQGAFNTGRDCSLVIIDQTFGRVDIPNVTGFQSAQQTANVRSDRLDGIQLNAELPKGWTGSFDLDRGDSGIDDLFAQREAAWLQSGQYSSATIYQYISESDGSMSTYQYDNVAMKLDDAGRYQGDAIVKQRISFTANRRRRV
jgi:hypothetical protein